MFNHTISKKFQMMLDEELHNIICHLSDDESLMASCDLCKRWFQHDCQSLMKMMTENVLIVLLPE